MSMNGKLNARGSQFLRGVTFTRINGDEATGGPINIAANSNYTVGFTSGVPAVQTTNAGSGFTIPADGLYKMHAEVYVSGVTPGIFDQRVAPEFGIHATLNNNTVFASRRVVPAGSGFIHSPYVGLTKLETEAIFEANGGEVLRIVIRSNSAAGGFVMIGNDWYPADGLHPVTTPAAVLNIQRMPTTALDSDTYLA